MKTGLLEPGESAAPIVDLVDDHIADAGDAASMAAEAAATGEATLWFMYDAIRVPTLLLRGAQSDLLTRETAQAMTQRGPKARLVEFEGVGHAPTLLAPDQVAAVREFLLPP